MKSPFSRTAGLVAISFLAGLPEIQAHSWVEQLMVIASNGTFVGAPGYPRGQVDRTVAGWNNDDMTFLVPPNTGGNEISTTQAMCQYPTPGTSQESERPVLTASAGDNVALRYQENGHVTQPLLSGLKPNGSGTVFIYGTSQPKTTDTYLAIHGTNGWNAAGTGGDGRGQLLATQYFDDGQCYQVNPSTISTIRQKEFSHTASALMGPDLWCQNNVQLPANINGTSYTLYWVWDWPTIDGDGTITKNESYTTCMDINISKTASKAAKAGVSFKKGQDLNSAAISTELGNPFAAPTATFAPINLKQTGVLFQADPDVSAAATAVGTKTGSAPVTTSAAASSKKGSKPTTATTTAKAANTAASSANQGANQGSGQVTVTVTETPTANGAVTVTVTQIPATVTVTTTLGQGQESAQTAANTAKTTKAASSVVASQAPNASAGSNPPSVAHFLDAASKVITPTTLATVASSISSFSNGTIATGSPKLRRHIKKHRLPLDYATS